MKKGKLALGVVGRVGFSKHIPVLLGAAGGEGSKARHEKVETREGDHVDRQLAQIGIQLPREPQTGCHSFNRKVA